MAKTLPAHHKTAHGFAWAYDEHGAHFYTRKTDAGYAEMRCLPSDLENGNFEFMAEHGLTNTNPVPRPPKARYWLCYAGDYFDRAEEYASKHAAIEAYRATLNEFDRYGSTPPEASLHIAATRADIAEYPDYVLARGPRGGVKVDRA